MSGLPFKVKAVYEYSSPHEDDLHFPAGQIITVTEEEDDDWYVGEYIDASGNKKDGLFPKNFVEKYEPTAPPRPTRTNRPKKEPEPAAASVAEPAPEPVREPVKESVLDKKLEEEPESEPEDPADSAHKLASAPAASKTDTTSPPPQAKQVEAAPSQALPNVAPVKQTAPPPVSEKPTGGSFRDRIAAFNKAAPPPAPFKPGGLGSGSNNFIKKPFVAPPPSKNAYVPPPREHVQPQKVYRREEDPEILAKEQENQEQAQRAGLLPTTNDGDEEDQPKPTSLKERIALLQKQQMEQAQRHAEAAAKKEKPKRPAKKRLDSHDAADEDGSALEKTKTEDTIGNQSIEPVQEEGEQPRRRKPSRGASAGTPGITPRKSFGDGNDADLSGAGDTTEEPEEISTSRDDSDEKPRTRAPPPPVRAPSARAPAPAREPDVGDEEGAVDEEGEESEEEDDDVDPEVRRREELRARMAKMSGGMGMHGMFGPMPVPSAPPKKKKASTEQAAEEVTSPSARAPPVPMIPLPGLSQVRSPEELNKQVGHEVDEPRPVTSARPADVVPDVEDVVPSSDKAAPSRGKLADFNENLHTDTIIALPPTPGGAPPVPSGRPVPPPVPGDCEYLNF